MDFLRDISKNHEALKKRIHNFRLPLSPFYLKVAQMVYFTIPIVIGYQIMEWTTSKSIQNLGASGELMKKSAADKGNKLDAYSTGTSGQNLALQSLLNSYKPTEGSSQEQLRVQLSANSLTRLVKRYSFNQGDKSSKAYY